MNAKKMAKHCKDASSKLEELEGLLAFIPPEKGASRFVYESMAAVRELRHIAKFETVHSVTVAQASHIHRILSKADYYLNLVPDIARDDSD